MAQTGNSLSRSKSSWNLKAYGKPEPEKQTLAEGTTPVETLLKSVWEPQRLCLIPVTGQFTDQKETSLILKPRCWCTSKSDTRNGRGKKRKEKETRKRRATDQHRVEGIAMSPWQ